MERGRWQTALELSSLPHPSPAGKEEKRKSFRTRSEKSLSLPEAKLSVCGTLAAAPHLHKHRQRSPRPHSYPGLPLQEQGPGHVLVQRPFLVLQLVAIPLAVVFPRHSKGIQTLTDCKDSVWSGPAGGVGSRAHGCSLLGTCPSPQRRDPTAPGVTHKGGDRCLWKAFSRKLASFSQSS